MGIKLKWISLLLGLLGSLAYGQQPQVHTGTPFAVNAKYTNGVAPGYWATAGAGLVLNISAGRVRCASTMTNYAGGTLTLANNTTNYVYLDTASSCVPGSNTSGYTSGLIAVATVVTSGGAITVITDDRTLGMSNVTGGAVGTVTGFSAGTLPPLFTTSVATASSTPALSFTLSNFAAHTFYGNNTGSTAAPGAQSIGEADLPAATVFTDQNATFGAHTYDFSGATIVKQRFSAGLTSSTNGDLGYDTTNKNWHLWTNAADKLAGIWSATPTNGNCVQASVSSSVVLLLDTGSPCGSGSGSVTSVSFTGGLISVASPTSTPAFTVAGTSGGVPYFSGSATWASSAALTNKQVVLGGGAGSAPVSIDFPDTKFIPAANCNNTTGGNGWSIGSGGSVTCRAGTNNLGGFIPITDTSSTFAQFSLVIPEDWDSATNPYIRFYVASTDTTNAHTIIPQIQVSCGKGDGTTTEDVTFNAAHSSSTITINTTNHQFWSNSNVQTNSTDMTGCVAGALMIVQVGRATDTATQAAFYGAQITFPRLLTVQAN